MGANFLGLVYLLSLWLFILSTRMIHLYSTLVPYNSKSCVLGEGHFYDE
jgi:hypothetical protein